jgi:hypothetical protein
MIVECKNILSEAIAAFTQVQLIVRSVVDEKKLLSERSFPFCSLITLPGKFDDRSTKLVKILDTIRRQWTMHQVRGTRNLPIQIRIFTKSEEEASSLAHDIIRNIPLTFEYNGKQGKISIGEEEHSDHVTRLTEKYLSLIIVMFSVEVAADPVDLPTITATEMTKE